jgi:hypothetical protein
MFLLQQPPRDEIQPEPPHRCARPGADPSSRKLLEHKEIHQPPPKAAHARPMSPTDGAEKIALSSRSLPRGALLDTIVQFAKPSVACTFPIAPPPLLARLPTKQLSVTSTCPPLTYSAPPAPATFPCIVQSDNSTRLALTKSPAPPTQAATFDVNVPPANTTPSRRRSGSDPATGVESDGFPSA